jgi:hypothetical protein
MAALGLAAVTVREWFLHQEVMAAVSKADGHNQINLTEIIMVFRGGRAPRRASSTRRRRQR